MRRRLGVVSVFVMAALPILTLAKPPEELSARYDFEKDAIGKAPTGFTSYATGGGPEGKWVVQEMAGAPSGKHVVVQTDADSTDTRFPVLIANEGEYSDV